MKQNKILQKTVGHVLHTLMVTLLFLWCGSITVSAEGTGTKDDPYVLEDGATYEVPAYKPFFAKFTAPSAGTFKLAGIGSYLVYTDETFATVDANMEVSFNGDYENPAYTFECESGKTYYVGNSFVMNAGTATFKFVTGKAEPVELKSCSPEAGSVFNAATGRVDLAFNQQVNVSGCLLTCGNRTASPAMNVTLSYVAVDVKDQLIAWYNDGSMKEGDEIKFTFTGISAATDNSVLYGTDGTLELTYTVGAKPLMLVSSINTPASETPVTNFKSYYMSNDETGIIKLIFSDNIGSAGEVLLLCGNPEPDAESEISSYYEEKITPIFDGNVVVFNLKGKLRRPADMGMAIADDEAITLIIKGVKDTKGNYAYSTGQGALGTFGFTFKYKQVAYDPVTDWLVVDGDAISSDTKNVELWLQETGAKTTFTGVKFAYKENGVDKTATVEANALTIVEDAAESSKTITIPVPNVNMDADSKVIVSLDGVETPSGVVPEALSKEFTCTGRTAAVSGLQITSAMLHAADGDVEMVNGKIGTIVKNTTATLTLSQQVGYITWEVTEPEAGSLKQSYATVDASTFDITFRGAPLKCLDGHTYTFTLKAYNNAAEAQGNAKPTIGTATFTFTGTEKEYVYSDVKLLNDINEEIDVNTLTDSKYVLEFSGEVKTLEASINLGMGASEPCKAEPVDGDYTKWAVTVSSSYDVFELSVWAKDAEGRAVNKTAVELDNPSAHLYGSEDNSWINIMFKQEQAQSKADFNISPASESELESISQLVFSFSTGISTSNAETVPIEVWNMTTRQPVATISKNDLHFNDNDFSDLNLYYEFETPITEPGTYNIVVPEGFFTLGEQFSTYTSNAATIIYVIKGQSAGAELTVTPASESTVESINKITFTYETGINTSYNGENIVIYKRAGDRTREEVAKITADDVKFDWDDASFMWIELAEPITETGIYEVEIPAGFFVLGESGDDTNEAMVVYYEIEESQPTESMKITPNVTGGDVIEIPERIEFTADELASIAYSEGSVPTLTNDAGESFAVHFDYPLDFNIWNEVDVVLDNGAITADGTYTLTIPAGAIVDGDAGTISNEEIVIKFVIGTGTGIDNIVANAGGKVDVYTVNGTNVLRNADAAAVKALAKGLYIINGKKVVIK